MLKIWGGKNDGYCDGVSRRSFLQIGGLAMGGMALPQLLRAEDASGIRNSHKGVIMIYLGGGPSHQDMYDIKEEAPSDYRGEFSAISTSVPGIRLCEHMPRIAANMDKFVAVRSVVGSEGDHSSYQCLTGRQMREKPQPSGGWPELGAILSKSMPTAEKGAPPYISMMGSRSGGGYLGSGYQPFSPSGKGVSDMKLNDITLSRLEDRKGLLGSFDQLRRDADNKGLMAGADKFNQQAFDVITSNRLVDALSSSKADPKDVERYNKVGGGGRERNNGEMTRFLTARRLIQAGARCVTLSFGGWDTHERNFTTLRRQLPALDHGVACLVEDLHACGLGDDVSVVVWGEFGRTPKVNKSAGRDHWPRVMGTLLAGGGMKTGQVIGATDRFGGEAANRAVHVEEIFATLYHNCGIDVRSTTLTDLSGRPQYLVTPGRTAMRELV